MLSATVAAGVACISEPRSPVRKLVILGFDGIDPDLAERWMTDGKLPTFASLAADGGFHRLEPTHPPDAASAWASFATGVNPGKHRVFDLIARNPATYAPSVAMVARTPGRFLFNFLPLEYPAHRSTRSGTSFWVSAGHAGVRSSILGVPGTFPPEEVPNGELLAGFPLPDVRGSIASYHYFATDVAESDERRTAFGGIVQRLIFRERVAQAYLLGPVNPLVHEGQPVDLRLPLAINWNHEARSVNIDVQGQSVHLIERQWSRWVDLDFDINPLTSVRAMAQFYLIDAGQNLQLYVSPLHWHPANPPAPMSSPRAFARELYDRLGPYRTLGWPSASWALNEGRLDERAFMDDLDRSFTDRAETILSRVDARNWDLLVGSIDATDRVQHMMWRLVDREHPMYDAELARLHGAAIERIYRRADRFTGELMRHLDPDTTVMIVSAHGFQPYRSSVNLNSWLVERGYMTLADVPPPTRTLHDLADASTFWENVDWSQTRAYALGFGQVFVNLAGREGKGIVSQGAEYDELLDSLIIDLMNFLDPRTQDRVVANVYKRREIYSEPYADQAADLIVALESGYRVSWQSALGGTPSRSIEPNRSKWSGDHSSSDYRTTAGVLITNRRISADRTRVVDIAPTVLQHFGVVIPDGLDGKAMFER
jgi:predicted AlkP superfamily phosphohydrolase/phosphomutase